MCEFIVSEQIKYFLNNLSRNLKDSKDGEQLEYELN